MGSENPNILSKKSLCHQLAKSSNTSCASLTDRYFLERVFSPYRFAFIWFLATCTLVEILY